jgi:hypothetical protein
VAKPGRKLKLTREVHESIIKHLRAGAFRKHAAEAAGVSEETVAKWITRGRAGERAYVAFYNQVLRVQAEDAIRNQAMITRAAIGPTAGDWKAAAWNLERKYPKQYGRAAAETAIGVTIEPGDDDNGSRTRVEFYIPDNGRRPQPGAAGQIGDEDEEEA